jgi:hypothetical protein
MRLRKRPGATWITEPAVLIRLNDSEHGFTPPHRRRFFQS